VKVLLDEEDDDDNSVCCAYGIIKVADRQYSPKPVEP
jgi:hypothetical protein